MNRQRVFSVLLAAGVVAFGAVGMVALLTLREPPAEAKAPPEEQSVTAMVVEPEDVGVIISGYGEVRPRREVSIASEVSGTVVRVHPNLFVGGIVRSGEVLFVVDSQSYEARYAEGEAAAKQLSISLRRLRIEYEHEKKRMDTLLRSRSLAESKFGRARELLAEDVGNQSEVDSAEQYLNEMIDVVGQLESQLDVFPIRIEEAVQALNGAEARLKMASIEVGKTQVRAPFDGRITRATVEVGHYAAAGSTMLEFVDDTLLEIAIKLDARDARQWLRFNDEALAPGSAWFTQIEKTRCEVRWTEDRPGHRWEGRLSRVERFDEGSRTLTVILEVSGADASVCEEEGLPLVAGMFCEVSIPGRTMKEVFSLPQWVVSVDSTVRVAKAKRLKSVPVEVIRSEGDRVYVRGGLQRGDVVITTRLVNPIENTLLDVALEKVPGASETAAAE